MTVYFMELGRNFPCGHVVPEEQLGISSEASGTGPSELQEPNWVDHISSDVLILRM